MCKPAEFVLGLAGFCHDDGYGRMVRTQSKIPKFVFDRHSGASLIPRRNLDKQYNRDPRDGLLTSRRKPFAVQQASEK
jgi:hypothetical protein